MANASPSLSDIAAVAGRCELSYHAVTAMYELCGSAIGSPPSDPAHTFVLLREMLRGLARDLENSAEILQNDRGGLGYFAAYYGSV
jgi:hypothetical protein